MSSSSRRPTAFCCPAGAPSPASRIPRRSSQKILDGDLPANFARLRAALKPLVGGDLSRVLYVTYGNPVLGSGNTLCSGGRDGFDVHPAFSANPARLQQVSEFLSSQFLPQIKALALCEGKSCRDAAHERMTFVEGHQAAFANHGLCAHSNEDPEFDRAGVSPRVRTSMRCLICAIDASTVVVPSFSR